MMAIFKHFSLEDAVCVVDIALRDRYFAYFLLLIVYCKPLAIIFVFF